MISVQSRAMNARIEPPAVQQPCIARKPIGRKAVAASASMENQVVAMRPHAYNPSSSSPGPDNLPCELPGSPVPLGPDQNRDSSSNFIATESASPLSQQNALVTAGPPTSAAVVSLDTNTVSSERDKTNETLAQSSVSAASASPDGRCGSVDVGQSISTVTSSTDNQARRLQRRTMMMNTTANIGTIKPSTEPLPLGSPPLPAAGPPAMASPATSGSSSQLATASQNVYSLPGHPPTESPSQMPLQPLMSHPSQVQHPSHIGSLPEARPPILLQSPVGNFSQYRHPVQACPPPQIGYPLPSQPAMHTSLQAQHSWQAGSQPQVRSSLPAQLNMPTSIQFQQFSQAPAPSPQTGSPLLSQPAMHTSLQAQHSMQARPPPQIGSPLPAQPTLPTSTQFQHFSQAPVPPSQTRYPVPLQPANPFSSHFRPGLSPWQPLSPSSSAWPAAPIQYSAQPSGPALQMVPIATTTNQPLQQYVSPPKGQMHTMPAANPLPASYSAMNGPSAQRSMSIQSAQTASSGTSVGSSPHSASYVASPISNMTTPSTISSPVDFSSQPQHQPISKGPDIPASYFSLCSSCKIG
jgi:hypothetical protein